MYAIIETGGKQYRVQEGDRVQVEKLPGDVGAKITFDRVLLVGGSTDAPLVGRPLIQGAAVEGEIVAHGRGPKITTFKLKKRKWYRRKIGHRQAYTELKVVAIRKGA
jgi:large subunit ribosomal protein L21